MPDENKGKNNFLSIVQGHQTVCNVHQIVLIGKILLFLQDGTD